METKIQDKQLLAQAQLNNAHSEINKMLSDLCFIGAMSSKELDLWKKLAWSNGTESAVSVMGVVKTQRETLINEFDGLATSAQLDTLRLHSPDRFRMLWRAKFLKEPDPKLFTK